MGKKSDRKNGVADDVPPNVSLADTDSASYVPDFTPSQWQWLKDQSRQFEKDYVPTRSLIPGL